MTSLSIGRKTQPTNQPTKPQQINKQTSTFKVSGPFVETSCIFQCIKNIINAEMWAWKNDYN